MSDDDYIPPPPSPSQTQAAIIPPPPVLRHPLSSPPPGAAALQRAALLRSRHNYSMEERVNFLTHMKNILPIGPSEWEEVCSLHSTAYPGRDVESLRRKYHILHWKNIPTENPHILDDVLLAKK